MTTSEILRAKLHALLDREEKLGRPFLEVKAGALHPEVDGYPDSNHQMRARCRVMRGEMTAGDTVVAEPPKGEGATLTIRYLLPRSG